MLNFVPWGSTIRRNPDPLRYAATRRYRLIPRQQTLSSDGLEDAEQRRPVDHPEMDGEVREGDPDLEEPPEYPEHSQEDRSAQDDERDPVQSSAYPWVNPAAWIR